MARPLGHTLRARNPHMHRLVSNTSVSAIRRTVVLTRERGKNEKLRREVEKRGWNAVEMPLVKAVDGPDVRRLPNALLEMKADWVVLTSPEAATVFLNGWREAGEPDVRVAAVGQGTAEIFEQQEEIRLVPAFVPSVANAKHFSAELPGPAGTVLYPASVKARTELEDGLHARGFAVERLNTYNTVTDVSHSKELVDTALTADAVTFASPSAVKAWVEIIQGVSRMSPTQVVACIGETSAKACKKLGLKNVYFPEEPGVAGWANSIEEGLRQCTQ